MVQVLQNPGKLGIGGYQSFGLSRMLADIGLVDAAWFYNWSSALPPVAADPWTLGEDVALGGTAADQTLRLGTSGDAWALQTVGVSAGRTYGLSLETAGGAGASGGVSVKFADAAGKTLASHWMPLDGTQGRVTLAGLVAPAGAVSARIVAWGSSGALELDAVSLADTAGTDNLVRNGEFEIAKVDPAAAIPVGFVPMKWGADAAGWIDTTDLVGAATVLGFNEPDSRQQADLTVAEALALWPDLMATGARLGSPATTTGQTLGATRWLGQFMSQANAAGLRVDFVAVHYYSANTDVAVFKTWLTKVYNAYHLPIWVTEWGLVDWSNPDRFSFTQTAQFFHDATIMMDGLGFVEKQAWFGLYDGLDGLSINAHLFDAAGQLTPVGQAFIAFSPVRDLTGTGGDDLLQGGANGDRLDGAAGDDTLVAGLGDDTLTGGAGADRFELGEVDRLNFGTDTIRDFDFQGVDADTLVFTFDDTLAALSDAADFAAFAAALAADGDAESAATLVGSDLVIDFGTGFGQAVLEGAGADASVAIAFGAVAPQVIAEYGSVAVSNALVSVSFARSFVNPVVLVTATTQNDAAPVAVRVQGVGATGFTLYLDEPNYLDGVHAPESVSWMVVEAGRWATASGTILEAGKLATGVLSSAGTTAASFSTAFDSAPLVLTSAQTAKGTDALWTRAAGVGTTGFAVVLQEEERLNRGSHGTETIGWLAVSRGSGMIDGATLAETSAAGTGATDHAVRSGFSAGFGATPLVLAGISSLNDGDTAGLRLSGLDAAGATLRLQEDTSKDIETTHAWERVDWFALDGGGTISGFDAALLG